MPNLEELGQLVKKRYPGAYDSLSDAEVGKRIQAKYPGAYDQFTGGGDSMASQPTAPAGAVPGQMARQQAASPEITRQMVAKTAASAAPVIGGMIGSAAGPAGTALGAFGGKGIQIGAESLIDPAEADRRAGLKGAVKSYVDMSVEALKQGGIDYFLRGASTGASKLIGKYATRFARPESVAVREAAARTGTELTALEKVGMPIKHKDIVIENVTKSLRSTMDALSPPQGSLPAGQQVADAFQVADENFHQLFAGEYQALDQLAAAAGKPGKVSGQAIKQEFMSLIPAAEKQLAKKAPGTMGAKGFAGATASDIKGLVKRVTKEVAPATEETFATGTADSWKEFIRNAPPEVQANFGYSAAAPAQTETKKVVTDLTFEQAQLWRSKMLQKAREEGTEEAVKAANRATLAIDKAMETTAKNVGIHNEWRTLNAAYKEAAPLFDTTFTKAQLKINPELILDSVKAGRPSQAMRVRDALLKFGGQDGRQAYMAFQRGYTERLVADPLKLPALLRDTGEETLKAVYGGNLEGRMMLKRLNDVSKVMQQVAKTTSPGAWGNLHEGVKTGVGFHLHLPVEKLDQGAAWVFTKIVENPKATALLIDGLQKSPKSIGTFMANFERAMTIATKAARIQRPDSPYLTNLDKVLSLGNAPARPAPQPTPAPAP